MKRLLHHTMVAALLVVALTPTFTTRAAAGTKKQEEAKKLETESQQAILNFKTADPTMTNFFAKAAGYVILPGVGEGGFILGGARGKGLVFENGKVVGNATMSEVSIGAQVGGGSYAEVIFFETAEGLKSFKGSKWEMSAKAKANVAASGAAANAKYELGIAVFTLPKSGAMVAAAVGGQKFKFEPVK